MLAATNVPIHSSEIILLNISKRKEEDICLNIADFANQIRFLSIPKDNRALYPLQINSYEGFSYAGYEKVSDFSNLVTEHQFDLHIYMRNTCKCMIEDITNTHSHFINPLRTTSNVCSAVRLRQGQALFMRTGSSKKLRANVRWKLSELSPWFGKG